MPPPQPPGAITCRTNLSNPAGPFAASHEVYLAFSGSNSGCTIVDCHQTVSAWPMADNGWLHRLDTAPVLDCPAPVAVA